LRREPGTLQFEVLRPRDDDGKILFYEVYTDAAAFKVHWEGALVARVRAETEGMIVKLTGTSCNLQE
jgi:quinol monooxygenase YgiN